MIPKNLGREQNSIIIIIIFTEITLIRLRKFIKFSFYYAISFTTLVRSVIAVILSQKKILVVLIPQLRAQNLVFIRAINQIFSHKIRMRKTTSVECDSYFQALAHFFYRKKILVPKYMEPKQKKKRNMLICSNEMTQWFFQSSPQQRKILNL